MARFMKQKPSITLKFRALGMVEGMTSYSDMHDRIIFFIKCSYLLNLCLQFPTLSLPCDFYFWTYKPIPINC